MKRLPVFLALEARKALVVGGGPVAFRKIKKLAAAGAQVRVVAPRIDERISKIPGIVAERREFAPSDIAGMSLVVAATDDPATNENISQLCATAGVFINRVDDAENSALIFGAGIDRGPVSVAVTTGGKSPLLSKWLRDKIAASIPAGLERAAERISKIRKQIIAREKNPARRRDQIRAAVEAELKKLQSP